MSLDKPICIGANVVDHRTLAYGSKQTAQALDSLNTSANLVKDAYADAKGRGALTDKLIMAAVVAMGIVAFMAIRKG